MKPASSWMDHYSVDDEWRRECVCFDILPNEELDDDCNNRHYWGSSPFYFLIVQYVCTTSKEQSESRQAGGSQVVRERKESIGMWLYQWVESHYSSVPSDTVSNRRLPYACLGVWCPSVHFTAGRWIVPYFERGWPQWTRVLWMANDSDDALVCVWTDDVI